MPDPDLATSLGDKTRSTVAALLCGAKRVALADFPNHSNVGDSLIWLGERALLRDLGVRVTYVSSPRDFDVSDVHRHSEAVEPILLQGGGNIGDLWPLEQQLRELIISSFPRRKIIQLPQSIHFDSEQALARARGVFSAHPDFTLLLRDTRSLEFAQAQLGCRTLLCPDVAFALSGLQRVAPTNDGVLWLHRADKERKMDSNAPPAHRLIEIADWLPSENLAYSRADELLSRINRKLRLHARPMAARDHVYAGLAKQRVDRGVALLSRGRVVVTDRLHGHILALLLGIPSVVLDNSYGKLRAFFETWTATSRLAYWADSTEQAAEIALRLASHRP